MNFERNTDAVTPLSWLNIIQRGGTEDWRRLYRLCHNPTIARQVAALLPLRDPDLLPSALLWKFLLEDLHPDLDLHIDLRIERHSVGV
jgi:hypothetical protein